MLLVITEMIENNFTYHVITCYNITDQKDHYLL